MRQNRWRSIQVLAVLVLGMSLSGCIGSDDSAPNPTATNLASPESRSGQSACAPETDENGSLTYDALIEVMTCVVGLYAWPTAWQPDTALLESMDNWVDGYESARYQNGYQYTQVGGLNLCAWALEWQDAHAAGDTARTIRALDYLLTVGVDPGSRIPEIPDDARADSTTDYLRGMFEAAELGDPTELQEFAQGCSNFDWPSR